jgi:hypothetical protein
LERAFNRCAADASCSRSRIEDAELTPLIRETSTPLRVITSVGVESMSFSTRD